MRLSSEFICAGDICEANTTHSHNNNNQSNQADQTSSATFNNQPTATEYETQPSQQQPQQQQPQLHTHIQHQRQDNNRPSYLQQQPTMRTPGEQLRELSTNDLNFLETTDSNELEGNDGFNEDGAHLHNCTVKDLENILDKFEADTQLLLDNPNQLLNCKYDSLKDPIIGFPRRLELNSVPFPCFSHSQSLAKAAGAICRLS